MLVGCTCVPLLDYELGGARPTAEDATDRIGSYQTVALAQYGSACCVIAFFCIPLSCPIVGTMCIFCGLLLYILPSNTAAPDIFSSRSLFVSRPLPLPDAAAEQRGAGREDLRGGGTLARNGVLRRISRATPGEYAASDGRSARHSVIVAGMPSRVVDTHEQIYFRLRRAFRPRAGRVP